MSERIEEIRERLGKATPGPWEVEAMDAGHSRYEMNVWITEKSAGDVVCDMDGLARSHNEKYDDDGYDDAAFIANAPADVAFLLDEVERLEREKANLAREVSVLRVMKAPQRPPVATHFDVKTNQTGTAL